MKACGKIFGLCFASFDGNAGGSLEDFFGSIHFGRVLGYFKKNKAFEVSHEVATAMAQLCCYQGKLPQGAPTSPVVANLVSEILDYRLLKVARKLKAYKNGRVWRIPREALKEYILENTNL